MLKVHSKRFDQVKRMKKKVFSYIIEEFGKFSFGLNHLAQGPLSVGHENHGIPGGVAEVQLVNLKLVQESKDVRLRHAEGRHVQIKFGQRDARVEAVAVAVEKFGLKGVVILQGKCSKRARSRSQEALEMQVRLFTKSTIMSAKLSLVEMSDLSWFM